MHWVNALAIFIMVGSGWRIYNDDVLFGWLHFPDFLVIGKWAQYGLQWHFLGMWIFDIAARGSCHRRGRAALASEA
jgi:thiosulfate reductase cytochrome b subunit